MPDFHYKAATSSGGLIEGTQSGISAEQVSLALSKKGLVPINVTLASPASRSVVNTDKLTLKLADQTAFTRDLSALLKSGMDLNRALKLLSEMAEVDSLKQLAISCRTDVKQGIGLSAALQSYEHQFGVFYLNLIKVAEASGRLPEVLENLADYMQQRQQLRSSIQSALIYPAILVVFGLISMIIMVTFVIPQFETLFADMGDALPAPTRILLAFSDLATEWGWLILIMITSAVFLLKRWFSTEAGKEWIQARTLSIPVLGKLVYAYQLSRFTRTLATLLGNGVSLVKSLSISTETVTYKAIKQPLSELNTAVKQGGGISATLEKKSKFSPMLIQMIRVGEETGNLPEALNRLSDMYDDKVRTDIKRAMTLFEPLLILGLGALVALMIIAMLLGILSVNEIVL